MARCATFAICTIAALAGCSKKDNGTGKSYAPLAPADALVAGVAELKGSPTNPMVQYLIDLELSVIGKLASLAEDNDESRQVMKQLELAKSRLEAERNFDKFDWVAGSMAKPSFKADDLDGDAAIAFPASSIVYAYSKATDFAAVEKDKEEYVKLIRESMPEDFDFAEVEKLFADNCEIAGATIAGCEAKVLKIKRNDDTEELLGKVSGLEPCYGLFDGRLLIVASSPAAFEGVVNLYSGKAPKSASESVSRDFALTGKVRTTYGAYGLSGFLREFLPADAFASLPEEARPFVESATEVRLFSDIDGDAMKLVSGVDFAFSNPEQATILRSILDGGKGMLNMGLAMVSMKIPAFSPILTAINDTAITAENGKCAIVFTLTKETLDSIDIDALATQLKAAQDAQKAALELIDDEDDFEFDEEDDADVDDDDDDDTDEVE